MNRNIDDSDEKNNDDYDDGCSNCCTVSINS